MQVQPPQRAVLRAYQLRRSLAADRGLIRRLEFQAAVDASYAYPRPFADADIPHELAVARYALLKGAESALRSRNPLACLRASSEQREGYDNCPASAPRRNNSLDPSARLECELPYLQAGHVL
jgi:hypothetical protein